MRIRKALVVATVTGTLVGGAVGVGTSMASIETYDSPGWLNPDGSIDASRWPSSMPLLDSSGQVVGYVNPDTYVNANPSGVTYRSGNNS